MAARIEFGDFRAAGGKVLARVDVTIDGWLTMRDVSLFYGRDDVVCLGMPQRTYQGQDGKTSYSDTVVLTQGARDGMLRRVWEAYLASPICQQKQEPAAECFKDDPFA